MQTRTVARLGDAEFWSFFSDGEKADESLERWSMFSTTARVMCNAYHAHNVEAHPVTFNRLSWTR